MGMQSPAGLEAGRPLAMLMSQACTHTHQDKQQYIDDVTNGAPANTRLSLCTLTLVIKTSSHVQVTLANQFASHPNTCRTRS